MIPAEFLAMYLTANAIALAILALALLMPRVARWAAVVIFVWASLTNTVTALSAPKAYLGYAALTPSAWYQQFILGWFSEHIAAMVLPIAAGQMIIAILLAMPRPWRALGVAGALTFLLAIAPLGVGAGFPFSITFGAAILIADRKLAARQRGALERVRADGSPAARSFDRADVCERHDTIVRAPASLVFDTAEHFDLLSVPIVRAIFRLRAAVMGAEPPPASFAQGLVAQTWALGWTELASIPHRLVVMGAVTQPWQGDVRFRGVEPEAFRSFAEPELVKIAWTFEVQALGPETSRLRTETIALATDADARRRFRRYWLLAGLGIVGIRLFLLPAIRREAERRFEVHKSRRRARGGRENSEVFPAS